MLPTLTAPINPDWTSPPIVRHAGRTAAAASVSDVVDRLASIDVDDIDPALAVDLSAATAELALPAGLSWTFRADDPPIALLRMLARIAMRCPDAGGPHTARLLDRLLDRLRNEPATRERMGR